MTQIWLKKHDCTPQSKKQQNAKNRTVLHVLHDFLGILKLGSTPKKISQHSTMGYGRPQG